MRGTARWRGVRLMEGSGMVQGRNGVLPDSVESLHEYNWSVLRVRYGLLVVSSAHLPISPVDIAQMT